MTTIIVNPGTGPVEGANETDAQLNLQQLFEDTGLSGLTYTKPEDNHLEGRYTFNVWYEGREQACEVEMPGLPLEQVRYMDEPGQNIWYFPRLYVDGSSWVWKYAINRLRNFWSKDTDNT